MSDRMMFSTRMRADSSFWTCHGDTSVGDVVLGESYREAMERPSAGIIPQAAVPSLFSAALLWLCLFAAPCVAG